MTMGDEEGICGYLMTPWNGISIGVAWHLG